MLNYELCFVLFLMYTFPVILSTWNYNMSPNRIVEAHLFSFNQAASSWDIFLWYWRSEWHTWTDWETSMASALRNYVVLYIWVYFSKNATINIITKVQFLIILQKYNNFGIVK